MVRGILHHDVRAGVDWLMSSRVLTVERRIYQFFFETWPRRVRVAVDKPHDVGPVPLRPLRAHHEPNRFTWRNTDAVAVSMNGGRTHACIRSLTRRRNTPCSAEASESKR